MDFSLNDEQTMLADSVARFFANDYDFDRRQATAATERGFSDDVWATYAELGWTAVPFSEADGGLDGGSVELMLLMEQFGRGLALEPYLASIVMAGGVLKRAANADQRERWLGSLIDGSLIGTLAFAEPQGRYNLADVATSAVRDGDDIVINGHKSVVLHGGSAGLILTSVRFDGERTDAGGIALVAIPATADGVAIEAYPTVDGLQAADIRFDNVRVGADHLVVDTDDGLATLEAVVDDATLAVSAEAVGIMQVLGEKTLDYTKNRVQFGLPIASFQALQHRMVDMFIATEETRSLLFYAVMTRDGDDTAATRAAISAIKHQIGTAGRHVGQEAVQLHGGMGVTFELDVAHYFKRLSAIDVLFGNADHHLTRYADLAVA